MEDLTPIGITGQKLDSINVDAQGRITAVRIYRRLAYARKSAPTTEVSSIEENKDVWGQCSQQEKDLVQRAYDLLRKKASEAI